MFCRSTMRSDGPLRSMKVFCSDRRQRRSVPAAGAGEAGHRGVAGAIDRGLLGDQTGGNDADRRGRQGCRARISNAATGQASDRQMLSARRCHRCLLSGSVRHAGPVGWIGDHSVPAALPAFRNMVRIATDAVRRHHLARLGAWRHAFIVVDADLAGDGTRHAGQRRRADRVRRVEIVAARIMGWPQSGGTAGSPVLVADADIGQRPRWLQGLGALEGRLRSRRRTLARRVPPVGIAARVVFLHVHDRHRAGANAVLTGAAGLKRPAVLMPVTTIQLPSGSCVSWTGKYPSLGPSVLY